VKNVLKIEKSPISSKNNLFHFMGMIFLFAFCSSEVMAANSLPENPVVLNKEIRQIETVINNLNSQLDNIELNKNIIEQKSIGRRFSHEENKELKELQGQHTKISKILKQRYNRLNKLNAKLSKLNSQQQNSRFGSSSLGFTGGGGNSSYQQNTRQEYSEEQLRETQGWSDYDRQQYYEGLAAEENDLRLAQDEAEEQVEAEAQPIRPEFTKFQNELLEGSAVVDSVEAQKVLHPAPYGEDVIIERYFSPEMQKRRIDLDPIHNYLIRIFLYSFHVDLKAEGDTSSNPSSSEKWHKLLKLIKIGHRVYSKKSPLESIPDGGIKSMQQYVFLTEPTAGFLGDLTEDIDIMLARFDEGTLPNAFDPQEILENPDKFADPKIHDLAYKYNLDLMERVELVSDVIQKSQSGHGSGNLGTELLSAFFKSIVSSFFSSTRGVSTFFGLGQDAMYMLDEHIEKSSKKEGGPDAHSKDSALRQTGDVMGAASHYVTDVQKNLTSRENVLHFFEEILFQISQNQSVAVVFRFFESLEHQMNLVFTAKFKEIPAQAIGRTESGTFNGVEQKGVNAIASKLFQFLFNHYPQILPQPIKKNMGYDLFTVNPKATEVDCLKLITRRFLPILTNVTQHMLRFISNSGVQEATGDLIDSGYGEPPEEVWRILARDPNNFKFEYVNMDDSVAVQEALEAHQGEYGADTVGRVLFNYNPYYWRAGKAAQAHRVFVVKAGNFVRYIQTHTKRRVVSYLENELKMLTSLASELADIMTPVSLMNNDVVGGNGRANVQSVISHLKALFNMISIEIDAQNKKVDTQIAAIRIPREEEVILNGKRTIFRLSVPHVFDTELGSTTLLTEEVDAVSYSDYADKNPGLFRRLTEFVRQSGEKELLWNAVSTREHPLNQKTRDWAEGKGVQFIETSIGQKLKTSFGEKLKALFGQKKDQTDHSKIVELKVRNETDLEMEVDTLVDFGYASEAKTLGEHLENLKFAKLAFGYWQGDAHIGNILLKEIREENGVLIVEAVLIDYGISAWMTQETLSSMLKIKVGIELGLEEEIAQGIYDLMLKDSTLTRQRQELIFDEIRLYVKKYLNEFPHLFTEPGDFINEMNLALGHLFPDEVFQVKTTLNALSALSEDGGTIRGSPEFVKYETDVAQEHQKDAITKSGVKTGVKFYTKAAVRSCMVLLSKIGSE